MDAGCMGVQEPTSTSPLRMRSAERLRFVCAHAARATFAIAVLRDVNAQRHRAQVSDFAQEFDR